MITFYPNLKSRNSSFKIELVVSNKKDAFGLERAKNHGIRHVFIDAKAFASAAEFDRELAGLVNENNIDLVCLAGYMKILSREFLDSVRAKVMNVHPALLPCFGGEGMYGMHVHEAVIESGVRVSGCTVHFVDYGADTGPIIIQKAVPVEPGDTPGSLQKKILPFEHEAYAEAVKLYCADRLEVKGKKVFIK